MNCLKLKTLEKSLLIQFKTSLIFSNSKLNKSTGLTTKLKI